MYYGICSPFLPQYVNSAGIGTYSHLLYLPTGVRSHMKGAWQVYVLKAQVDDAYRMTMWKSRESKEAWLSLTPFLFNFKDLKFRGNVNQ